MSQRIPQQLYPAVVSQSHCLPRIKKAVQLLSAVTCLALGLATGCGDETQHAVSPQLVAQAPLTGETCDLTGTWAMRFEFPVTWNTTLAIQGGSGTIVQFAKSTRRHDAGDVVDTLSLCRNFVPDSAVRFADKFYGIEFPTELFDSGLVPPTEVRTHADAFTVGAAFVSEPAVVQMGLNLGNPLHDPWPTSRSAFNNVLVDTDQDQFPGITVTAKQGGKYTLPPVNLTRDRFGTHFFTAVRQIARVSGHIDSCDKSIARAEILTVAGSPAIHSSVIGCIKNDGSQCRESETGLVNNSAAKYVPNGPGRVVMQRVNARTTCADVRALRF